MRLYLLRHAHPLAAATHQPDFERELSPSGLRQLPKIAGDIIKRTNSFSNLVIYSSTARRTRQTVQGVIGNISGIKVKYLHELYLPKREQLLDFVNNLSTSKDILLVGHNPGLSQLASYYSGEQISLSPGDLITLDFSVTHSDGFSKDTAVIIE